MKNLRPHIKTDKKINFNDTEIENNKFNQHKSPILRDKKDINEKLVSKKVVFGKKMILNILFAINMLKLDLYACYFKNWFHTEEILIKLNVYIFW